MVSMEKLLVVWVGGAVTALLEWVQPRTEPRGVDVNNFTTRCEPDSERVLNVKLQLEGRKRVPGSV